MALIVPVLVRGINNLSDARYCAGMGADRLAFNLDPATPGHLTPEAAQELSGWVAGVDLVGEFDTLPAPDINALAQTCGLKYVLLRRLRSVDAIAELSRPVLLNMQWIPDFLREDVEVVFRQYSPHVAGFLMTGLPERPLDGLQLTYLTDLARKFPLWIGSNLLQNPVRNMIHSVRPAGLLLEGGEEIKPGLRDFTELEAMFEQLEEE
ncbi:MULTISPECIES: beta/alpha barrel domain-containing protein [Hymenobacter]|uniref:Phosphoribosylanthranilate isomerase n=1 Tax=Hymenobacter jejuensis TaxID=2502781 RepID=A0A5B8A5Q5_9BACT|nr:MULTISPECIES: hypothetical protein [Hymenobacter]MBC6989979.1 hypothetical protein [Hymenobacter sp. BT491]QDA62013.1 hypothetical protein FHG12_18740 [Hymenobacter jejuensis]